VRDREDGFTMVELMVIVLIIGLLVAIALPTMIGARHRANDAHAKGMAARALRAGKIVYADDQTYANTTPAALTAADPGMTYVDGATSSPDPETVSSAAPSQHEFVVAAYSATGSCFFLMDDAVGAGLSYGRLVGPAADCYANNAGAVTFGASW
jgi:type IV pilus assembly protein PilA